MVIGFGAKNGEVGTFFSPRETGIDRGGGVENADGSGAHVEELDAVAGFVVSADGHGEKRAGLRKILPGVFGAVAKRGVAAVGELAEKQRGAGWSVVGVGGVGGIFFVRVLFFGRRVAHGEPGAVGTEGEGFDTVYCGEFAGGEIEKADFLGDGLFVLFQLFFLRFGNADGISDPAGIGGESGLRAESNGLGCAIGDVGDAQFVVAIGTIDAVGEPFAVGGEAAIFAESGERFPLAVVEGRDGRFGLRIAEDCGGKNQNERKHWASHGWPSLGDQRYVVRAESSRILYRFLEVSKGSRLGTPSLSRGGVVR